MSLKFKRFHQSTANNQWVALSSFMGLIILLLTSIVVSASFSFQPGVKTLIPKAITSDMIKDDNLIIITSENIIYINDRVFTLKEMEIWLNDKSNRPRQLLIKANRRSSVGRIMEVWDLCRKAGVERIQIATNQEN